MEFGIPSVGLYGKMDLEREGGTRIEIRQAVPMFWLWLLPSPIVGLVLFVVAIVEQVTGVRSLADDPERSLMMLTWLPGTLVVMVLLVRRLISQMEYPMFYFIERLLEAEEVVGATFDQPFVWMDLRA